jgi:hypothetical protein
MDASVSEELMLLSCEDWNGRFHEDAVSCLPMNVFVIRVLVET